MTSPGFAGCAARERVTAQTDSGRQAGRLEDALGPLLLDVLALASRAPSAYNAQPWRVLVHHPQRWSLTLAPDRRLPAVDPADRGAILGIGAFLENLCLAGAALGYKIEPTRYGAYVDDPALVSLRLERCRSEGNAKAIALRRTTRCPFARTPVASRDVSALCDGLDHLMWIPGDARVAREVREIVAGAAGSQLGRWEARTELAAWLRRSREGGAASRDGMVPEDLQLGGVAGWLAHQFSDPRVFTSVPFRRLLAERAARLASACGGWLLVATPDASIPSLVDAGRRLERLFLRARGLGLGIHPMSQPLQEPGWRQDLERATGLDAFPRMLLRVGYTRSWPAHAAPRLAPGVFTHVAF
jgi:nitroreductase